jgi:hypothetical protein
VDSNPSRFRLPDSPKKVISLNSVIKEKGTKPAGGSILLDKEERELVKKGENVTKEEMWSLLEMKRFEKLKDAAVNL